MFSIKKEKIGKYTKVKLVNESTQEYVSFILNFGGKLSELVLQKHKDLYSILQGDIDGHAVSENKGSKGNLLCPFPNRVNEGKYNFSGKEYTLPINPKHGHAIHGLVFDKEFTIIEEKSSEKEASVTINYEGKEFEGYPFSFLVEVTYTLSADGFTCTTRVTNKGKENIPVGIGWHPYFTFGGKVDDLLLELPVSEELLVDTKMIPTGENIPVTSFVSKEIIGNANFDTGYKVNKEGITRISNNKATIEVWQETGKGKYNYVQVYIPKDRTSIAIEPMTCPANAFNSKEGLIVLKPEETISASYGVKLI